MAVLITDPLLEERFIEERKVCGSDRWDEVWEGLYIVTPPKAQEAFSISIALI